MDNVTRGIRSPVVFAHFSVFKHFGGMT